MIYAACFIYYLLLSNSLLLGSVCLLWNVSGCFPTKNKFCPWRMRDGVSGGVGDLSTSTHWVFWVLVHCDYLFIHIQDFASSALTLKFIMFSFYCSVRSVLLYFLVNISVLMIEIICSNIWIIEFRGQMRLGEGGEGEWLKRRSGRG